MAEDRWDATFAGARFTVSPDGLTATATLHNATDTIIGTKSHSIGDKYFELRYIDVGNGGYFYGLAPGSTTNGTYLGNTIGGAIGSVGLAIGFSSGNWFLNGSGGNPSGYGATRPANGAWLGFAVKFSVSGIAFCVIDEDPEIFYGNNGVCDVVAGTGMFDFSAGLLGLTPLPAFIGYTSQQNGVDESVVMNARGSPWNGILPPGYDPWQPPDPIMTGARTLLLPRRATRLSPLIQRAAVPPELFGIEFDLFDGTDVQTLRLSNKGAAVRLIDG